jgi:hypothetical protein
MSRDVAPRQAETRFQLSFNSLMRVLMTPLLAGPRRCVVQLTAKRLKVRMGLGAWAFSARVPRSSITAARRVSGPVLGWGAHGWRGRWLINGSSRGLVRVSIDPPGRGRCLVVPVTLRELTLSLERPDEFVSAITAS